MKQTDIQRNNTHTEQKKIQSMQCNTKQSRTSKAKTKKGQRA